MEDNHAAGNVLKEGYLFKQSEIVKRWNERYFVLEDTCLMYFMKKGDPRPKLLIDLSKAAHVSNVSTTSASDRLGGLLHQFRLTCNVLVPGSQMPTKTSYVFPGFSKFRSRVMRCQVHSGLK